MRDEHHEHPPLDLVGALERLVTRRRCAAAIDTIEQLSRHPDAGRIAAAYLRASLLAARVARGWRPLHRSHACLGHVLRQGRCRRRTSECRPLPGADHTSLWTLPDGEVVLVTEPYGWDAETIIRAIAACAELGLKLRLDGQSPHFPGWTTCVVVSRNSEAARRLLQYGPPRLAALPSSQGEGNASTPARAPAVSQLRGCDRGPLGGLGARPPVR